MESIYENTPLEECIGCPYRLSRLKRDLELSSLILNLIQRRSAGLLDIKPISPLPRYNSYACSFEYCGLDGKDKVYGPLYRENE